MKKLWPFVLIALCFVAFILWQKTPTPPSSEEPVGKILGAPPAILEAPVTTNSVTSTAVPLSIKKLETVIPSTQKIRDEVAKDPHDLPPSLRSFAMEMATHMEEALRDEEKAKEFFTELQECSSEAKDHYPSVRISCALNGLRLVEKYPKSLGVTRQSYYRSLSPSLQQAIQIDQKFK